MRTEVLTFDQITAWLILSSDLKRLKGSNRYQKAEDMVSGLNEVPGSSFTYKGVTVTFDGRGYIGEK